MNSNNINPIFIIGAPRTGTTWLGNIIASRFNTSTAIHPLHYGVKEANLYLNHKYWGGFNDIDQYISFLELYEASDFFQILNHDKNHFYKKRYSNFYDFFFDLMDHYAEKEGKEYWSIKLCPNFFWDQKEMSLVLSLIQKKYDSPKFIIIKRGIDQYFESYLNMSGASHARRQLFFGKLYSSLLGIARYTSIYHSMDTFSKKVNGLIINYQDLKIDTQSTLNQISNYIDLPIIDNNRLKDIPRNTSFSKGTITKPSFLHPLIKALLSNNKIISRLISKLYDLSKKPNNPAYFRILKAKYFRDNLKAQLKKTGHTDLINHL